MTTETTDTLRSLLTDEDIAVLNRARSVLADLARRTGERGTATIVDPPAVASGAPDAEDYGYLRGYAEEAEDAVFKTIVRAHHHCKVPMTKEQIHNRAEETVEGVRFAGWVRHPEADRPAYVGDGREPFQGDSPGEHDHRL